MSDDVEAALADIEQTREHLRESVDQLADRLDPRVRAREAGASLQQTAADGVAAARRNPVSIGAIAAAVVALAVAVVLRRRHRRRGV